MDLNLLKEPLPVVENPGLETTDPRLEEVSSLVQRAQYIEAAELAQSVLAEGINDIRMIGFLSYGVFLERGIGSLKEILLCLAGVLRDSWSAVGPAVKREKHAQTSLRWFSNQLLKKLQYEENAKSELWERWVSEVTSDEIGETLDAADELKRISITVLEDAATPLIDGLAKLVQWLQALQQVVYREDVPEAEPEPEQESMEASEEDAEIPHVQRGGEDMRQVAADLPASEEGLVIEGSYYLRALMKKIAAFERLVAEEKYPRAALVAEDINESIASFDPRLYFPKLFARYAYLRAAHFQDLFAFDDQRETAEWQALKEFYRVDLEGFVES
ncbi:MAG: type VI secretion system protein IglI family protein [Syntrophobacteraceae bacterium]